MADRAPQSFENHSKYTPLYHFILFPLFTLYFFWKVYLIFARPSIDSLFEGFAAFGFLGILWVTRIFPLTVQDRVIRIEERVRLQRLLPPELAGRIGELSRRQFVALRFAPDAEVPELFPRILNGELSQPADIKKAIDTWRADHFRI
ncbi:MAG: hypothetical protein KDD11_15395 [Acidobacteria bacterium]|nr:hypothetical protein [Acidobacteriota bacterium]